MATYDRLLASEALSPGEPASALFSWITSIGVRLGNWIKTHADHWAAAAMYLQLSARSDAVLARRGLSRVTLAQDVRMACDRSGDA